MGDTDLNKWKVGELRDELSSRGLDTKGVKAVLVKRLRAAMNKEAKEKSSVLMSPPSTTDEDVTSSQEEPKEPNDSFNAVFDAHPVEISTLPESSPKEIEPENIPSEQMEEVQLDKFGNDSVDNKESKAHVESEDSHPDVKLGSIHPVVEYEDSNPVVEHKESHPVVEHDDSYPVVETKDSDLVDNVPVCESKPKFEKAVPHVLKEFSLDGQVHPQKLQENEEMKVSEAEITPLENVKFSSTECQQADSDLTEAITSTTFAKIQKEQKIENDPGIQTEVAEMEGIETENIDGEVKGIKRKHGDDFPSIEQNDNIPMRKERSGRERRSRWDTIEAEPEVEKEIEETVFDENVVTLDTYHSDLNLVIDKSRCGAHPLTDGGFALMWAGARATHGVLKGKICFEVMVGKHLDVSHLPADEPNPHVVRVGFSVEDSTMQLGEDPLSYGYGGTGKISTNCQFQDFGTPFASGDCVTAFLNLDSDLVEIGFAKNGEFAGWAYKIEKNELDGKALFPHVLTKNISFDVNFGQKEQPYFALPDDCADYIFLNSVLPEDRIKAAKAPDKREECEMIMMCGLPAAGKSVWATAHAKDNPDKKFNILGTNNIIDKMKVMGLPRKRNYSGRWDVLIQMANRCLNKLFEIGSKLKRNFILDQTNVYPTAQRRKMRNFEGFIRKAVVIVPEEEEFKKRCEAQDKDEGKEVPDDAVNEMKANFKLPEVGDMFDDIIFPELQRDEAEPMVKKFNEEGRTAVGPANKRFRPNQENKRDFQNFGGFEQNRRNRDDFNDRGRYQDRGGRQNSRDGFDGGRNNSGRGMMRGHNRGFPPRGGFDRDFGRRGGFDRGFQRGRGGYDRDFGGRGGFDRGSRGRGDFDRGSRGRGGFPRGGGGLLDPPMDFEDDYHSGRGFNRGGPRRGGFRDGGNNFGNEGGGFNRGGFGNKRGSFGNDRDGMNNNNNRGGRDNRGRGNRGGPRGGGGPDRNRNEGRGNFNNRGGGGNRGGFRGGNTRGGGNFNPNYGNSTQGASGAQSWPQNQTSSTNQSGYSNYAQTTDTTNTAVATTAVDYSNYQQSYGSYTAPATTTPVYNYGYPTQSAVPQVAAAATTQWNQAGTAAPAVQPTPEQIQQQWNQYYQQTQQQQQYYNQYYGQVAAAAAIAATNTPVYGTGYAAAATTATTEGTPVATTAAE